MKKDIKFICLVILGISSVCLSSCAEDENKSAYQDNVLNAISRFKISELSSYEQTEIIYDSSDTFIRRTICNQSFDWENSTSKKEVFTQSLAPFNSDSQYIASEVDYSYANGKISISGLASYDSSLANFTDFSLNRFEISYDYVTSFLLSEGIYHLTYKNADFDNSAFEITDSKIVSISYISTRDSSSGYVVKGLLNFNY